MLSRRASELFIGKTFCGHQTDHSQSRLPLAVYVASDSGGAVLTDGFGDLSGWRWERSADSFRDAYGQADIHPWHGSSSSACLGWIHAIITGKVDLRRAPPAREVIW
jgi:hypothetical protein